MTNFIQIEEVTGEKKDKVYQALRFQTGNFVWRVRFNLPLRTSTVNNQSCFVTTVSGTPLNTKIHYNAEHNYIEIEPQDAYAKNTSYILNVTTKVASLQGKNLKENIRIRFRV